MANAPLLGQDSRIMPVICPEKTLEYFCVGIWTGQISLIALENFLFWRIALRAV
jgi:hypothetical protein